MKPKRDQGPPSYPFVPKSTRGLRPGDFWAVPMTGGRFAAGRIVQVDADRIPTPTRAFLGALMDWCGTAPPSADDLAGRGALAWGVMHVRAITELGGAILGHRPLELDGLRAPEQLSAMGGAGAMILDGARSVRVAREDEWGTLPVLAYWGYDAIQRLAEAKLG